MKHFNRKNRSAIAVAAGLRAAGKTWEEIATAIGRSAERVRRCPRLACVPTAPLCLKSTPIAEVFQS